MGPIFVDRPSTKSYFNQFAGAAGPRAQLARLVASGTGRVISLRSSVTPTTASPGLAHFKLIITPAQATSSGDRPIRSRLQFTSRALLIAAAGHVEAPPWSPTTVIRSRPRGLRRSRAKRNGRTEKQTRRERGFNGGDTRLINNYNQNSS